MSSEQINRTAAKVTVRMATPADLEFLVDGNALLALETEHLVLDRTRLKAGVQAIFDDASRGCYRVAEVDGVRAGQMLVTYEWSDWRNGMFWWIQSVYTVQEHRRRGVFHALYRAVESEARRRSDVCGLRLYVENENRRAQATYEGCGMRRAPYGMFEVDFVLGRDSAANLR